MPSAVKDAVDCAWADGRLSTVIDANLWDLAMPIARSQCGQYFRYMLRPWQCFMYQGIWIERGNKP